MNPNYVLTEDEKKKRFHKGDRSRKGKKSPGHQNDSMDATNAASPEPRPNKNKND